MGGRFLVIQVPSEDDEIVSCYGDGYDRSARLLYAFRPRRRLAGNGESTRRMTFKGGFSIYQATDVKGERLTELRVCQSPYDRALARKEQWRARPSSIH